jgi:hypothetical protein
MIPIPVLFSIFGFETPVGEITRESGDRMPIAMNFIHLH